MMFYPIKILFQKDHQEYYSYIIAYLCYLMICMLNPLFFSSSGMVFLAVILNMVFQCEKDSITGDLKLEKI